MGNNRFLNSTVGTNFVVEPTDVIITKRVLQKTNNYQVPRYGLTDFTDGEMFSGIKKFQNDNGLKVDAIMHPEGPTEEKMGHQMFELTKDFSQDVNSLGISAFGNNKQSSLVKPKSVLASHIDNEDDDERTKECDHLYWHIDIPTCRGIQSQRGNRAAARCFHSATARYAMCLKGNALPPLDTWNQ